MELTFCIAEDRVTEESGVRLTLLSLRRHHPEATVYLYRPNPSPDLLAWLRAFPKVVLITEWPGTAGWNCKPQALLGILDRGHPQVIWLDSDILVTRPCGYLFAGLDDKTMVTARDPVVAPHQGTAVRTESWGLPVGRRYPLTLNSCVLRVTQVHRPLLEQWNKMLSRPDYLEAQKLPLMERPLHLLGDQDALNALIGSADFQDVDVHFLRLGRDVAHTGGARTYSLPERIGGLFHRVPPFLHNQWAKPWIVLTGGKTQPLPDSFWIFHRVILESSPYVALSRTYESELGTDTTWLRYCSSLGRVMRILSLGHYALRGLPLTMIAEFVAELKLMKSEFGGMKS